MGSSRDRLSALQRELLEAFFQREQRFSLTGGGALAGFHLKHRESRDLDLFARTVVDLDLAERALEDSVRACGAACRTEVRYPEFRRYLVERGQETTLVDLAIDRAPEVDPDKVMFGVVRVDSLREIAANKICTVLSRCEIRDLVDLKAILEAGIELEAALADAKLKDGGVDPATLAWLLSELHVTADASLPGGIASNELLSFRDDIVRRLRALAFPGP